MLFTKKELIVLFNENNLKQPKAKYSNNIILKMLENVSEDFTAEVECTRKGFSVNRGSLVECIIKSVVYGVNETKKSNFFRESVGELKKVTWPTKDDVLASVGVVLVLTILMAIILGALDLGFTQLFTLLMK